MGSENSADQAWDFLSSWFVDIGPDFIWHELDILRTPEGSFMCDGSENKRTIPMTGY
jgi:hypothetical protein